MSAPVCAREIENMTFNIEQKLILYEKLSVYYSGSEYEEGDEEEGGAEDDDEQGYDERLVK